VLRQRGGAVRVRKARGRQKGADARRAKRRAAAIAAAFEAKMSFRATPGVQPRPAVARPSPAILVARRYV